MKLKRFRIGIALLAILATAACIHKTSGQVTPWEKVAVANAIFASSNNTVAKGTIAVQQSGLITVQQAKPILEFTEVVARDHDQITNIIATKPAVTSVPAIKALIDDVSAKAKDVVNSGGAGVKNPNSQRTISEDITAVTTAADAVLTAYIAAAGGTQ